MNRRTRWTARLAPLVLLLPLILVACGGTGSPAAVGEQLQGGGDMAEEPAASAARDGVGSGTVDEEGTDALGAPPLAAPIEQRIVKTGEVTLEVGNVGEAIGRVRALATELSGYVGGSQAGTLDDRATLTIRIPAASFDEALARLHEMDAEVIAEATREQDVTSQVVDLEARIENLRASEASYRELAARAERVDDVLAVQSRLDDVRGQIEQLQAQLDAVEGQAALSTLTVTLVPRPTPVEARAEAWDPGGQLDRALASLVGIGQGLFDGLVWFVIVWLPILLVLALFGLLALRGVLEVRRRMPPTGAVARPGGDEGTA
jgi:hypothetical protein